MIFIKDKMNYVNNDTGFLTADEFNSMKNELANIVKYRSVLDDNDDNQILKAIIAESKTLFYTDNGTVNRIKLNRANEVNFLLDNDQVFMFSPAYTNTSMVTIKVGNNLEKRLLLGGNELPIGFLDTTVSYVATYRRDIDAFEIKNLTTSKTSDFVFSDLHNEATFIKVNDYELGSGLYNNAVVYIDQTTNKYELAAIEVPKSQKQNAIAIYKIINGEKYLFIDGIVPDFDNGLISGLKYYLDNNIPGVVNKASNAVCIGRYIKDGRFLLNITGDVSIDINDIVIITYENNITNGMNTAGVIFTDISNTLTLMYDTKTFNALATKKVMFVNVDGTVSKIEFAPEYTNDVFNIEVNGLRYGGIFKEANVETNPIDIYELGSNITDITKPILSSTNKTFNTTVGKPLTLETVTAFDNSDGAIAVTRSGSVNFNVVGTYLVTYTAKDSSDNSSTITHTYNVTAAPVVVTYDTVIVNPENSNGVAFTNPSANMTLMFNKIAYDKTTPALIMFIKVNNITAKLDYAPEYNGRTFEVEIAGVRYIGTFAENESYSNPTIINIKQ